MNDCHSEIIQQLLVDLGFGVLRSQHPTSDWPIYATQMADIPDKAICIHDTESQLDGRKMVDGENMEHKGFQVMVRAPRHEEGFEKIETIRIALDQYVYDNEVILGTHVYQVHSVTRKGGILSLGRDVGSSDRQLFTINGIVALRQLS